MTKFRALILIVLIAVAALVFRDSIWFETDLRSLRGPESKEYLPVPVRWYPIPRQFKVTGPTGYWDSLFEDPHFHGTEIGRFMISGETVLTQSISVNGAFGDEFEMSILAVQRGGELYFADTNQVGLPLITFALPVLISQTLDSTIVFANAHPSSGIDAKRVLFKLHVSGELEFAELATVHAERPEWAREIEEQLTNIDRERGAVTCSLLNYTTRPMFDQIFGFDCYEYMQES